MSASLFLGKYSTAVRKIVDCVIRADLIVKWLRFFFLSIFFSLSLRYTRPNRKHVRTRFRLIVNRDAEESTRLQLLLFPFWFFSLIFFWSRLKAFPMVASPVERGKKSSLPRASDVAVFYSLSVFFLLFCLLFSPGRGRNIMITWFMRRSWSVPANFSKIFT